MASFRDPAKRKNPAACSNLCFPSKSKAFFSAARLHLSCVKSLRKKSDIRLLSADLNYPNTQNWYLRKGIMAKNDSKIIITSIVKWKLNKINLKAYSSSKWLISDRQSKINSSIYMSVPLLVIKRLQSKSWCLSYIFRYIATSPWTDDLEKENNQSKRTFLHWTNQIWT